MSAQDWKLDGDLCRCCHSEGTFKSLSSSDTVESEEVIYSDLLRDCLNIELKPVEGPIISMAYSICGLCIARLQDTYSFKQQVLKCEEYFINLYSKNCIKVASDETEIKQEPDGNDSDSDRNDADFASMDDGDCIDFTFIDEELPKKGVKRKKLPKLARVAKKRARARTRTCDKPDDTLVDAERKSKKPPYRLLRSDYEHSNGAVKCTRCGKIFNSLSAVRVHVKYLHLETTKHPCTLCNKTFRTLAPFIRHKLEEHSIDDRLRCNACDNIFNTNTQLIRHKNNFHMLGTKHKCPHCEYECYSVENMYKHKFKHKTVKDYQCKFCKKAFLRKATLDLHERIHTGDRRKICAECGQAFVQKASLNYHMTKYHPEVNF